MKWHRVHITVFAKTAASILETFKSILVAIEQTLTDVMHDQ